jgi:hypothetical protein
MKSFRQGHARYAFSARGKGNGRHIGWPLSIESSNLPFMKNKEDIVKNWLPRYTDTPLKSFGEYILLTNFINYVDMFATQFDVEIRAKTSRCKPPLSTTLPSSTLGWEAPWRLLSWTCFRR